MPQVKRRRVPVGPWEFHVALRTSQAERIRRSLPYRRIVKPTLAALEWAARPFAAHHPPNADDLPPGVEDTHDARAILRQIADIGWYHTIELGYGITTPGMMDHRPVLERYGVPARLDGKRVLDVATFDGFWAFEFESRGAADVLALDIERFSDADLLPRGRKYLIEHGLDSATGEGFHVARDILRSKVRRRTGNVYELSEEKVGKFDLVFLSDLLLHLTSPIEALQNCRVVTEGSAIIAEVFDPDLGDAEVSRYMRGWGRNFAVWWLPSLRCLVDMVKDAGFRKVKVVDTFRFGARDEQPYWRAIIHASP